MPFVEKILTTEFNTYVSPIVQESDNILVEQPLPEEVSEEHIVPEEVSEAHIVPDEVSKKHIVPEEVSEGQYDYKSAEVDSSIHFYEDIWNDVDQKYCTMLCPKVTTIDKTEEHIKLPSYRGYCP